MIQKISPAMNVMPKRAILKSVPNPLRQLAGYSLGGGNPPIFQETEMIIPGGLTFKEKAYYLLSGKLPNCVYKRWFPNNGEHVLNTDDQLVTVERTCEGGIGSIIQPPHGIDAASIDLPDNGGMLNAISGIDGVPPDVSTDGDISTFEIWKHLAGFQ